VNPDYGSVVLFDNGENLNSVLDGFTLTNGKGTWFDFGMGYWDYVGSGIYCSASSPTILNNRIINNIINGSFYSKGGGIFCDHSSPNITNNTITSNTAYNGGGISCLFSSSPNITNNTISKNSALDIGGGIFCMNASPNITGNTINGNTAIFGGGGIGCQCYKSSSSPTITNNDITANFSKGGGGGIDCYSSYPIIMNNTITGNLASCGGGISYGNSTASITSNIIIGNSASLLGGGIYCDNSAIPSITNNIINGNSASQQGGGIYCDNSVIPSIINNAINGNSASDSGGGIYCEPYSRPEIMNNSIIGNSAYSSSGGGIYCNAYYPTKITNTISWGNTAPSNPEIYGNLTVSYSNVKGGYPGTGNINSDPLFIKGPNGFFYLSQKAAGQPVDSPCVDTGNDLASNLGMDIYWTRTDSVPDSGTVDMGFHYGPFTFPSLQTDTSNISASTGGTASFLLLGETPYANRNYLTLGSISGNDPGIPLPSGQAVLPLKWDLFTDLVLSNINTPFFNGFMGKLDSTGASVAILNTLSPITPAAVGYNMHFAYALNGPWDFASNPVSIKIVP